MYTFNEDRAEYALTNLGLSIQVMLIPWAMHVYLLPLSLGVRSRDVRIGHHDCMCIFVRKTNNHLHFIRTTFEGSDLTRLKYREIIARRDTFGIQSQRVFLRQENTSKGPYIYYGFEFNHAFDFVFHSSRHVLCRNIFDMHVPRFEVSSPGAHAAGIIRFAIKDNRPVFMYLGFDLHFDPVCLITTDRPPLPHGVECDMLHGDLSALRSDLKDHLLNLPWLLGQIAAGTNEDTYVAFTADKVDETEVICAALHSKISFNFSYYRSRGEPRSSGTRRWLVDFPSWDAPRSEAHIDSFPEPEGDSLVTAFYDDVCPIDLNR